MMLLLKQDGVEQTSDGQGYVIEKMTSLVSTGTFKPSFGL